MDSGKDKYVTLTFYVAYGNQKYLMDLLDMLDQYNVKKAVFFVEGRYQFDHPYSMKRIEHMGYDIKTWTDLKHYNEQPYQPSVYKDVPLIQASILSNVSKDRVGANFLNGALYNHAFGTKGVIVAFTPTIMAGHQMILEEILKQKDIIFSNEAFAPSKIKTVPIDTKTTSPIKISSGKWTMESLQKNYPSTVKNGPDGSYVIVDPLIIRRFATLDIKDDTVYINTGSVSNYSAPAYIRIMGKASIVNSTNKFMGYNTQ